MNRIAFSFALMIGLLASVTRAQQPTAGTTACPPSATLDDLTKALDDAVSGPRDKDRTCLRDRLLPEARSAPIRKEQESRFTPRILEILWESDATAGPVPEKYLP
jgi:hypothetical protein